MRTRLTCWIVALAFILTASCATFGQASPRQSTPKTSAASAPKRDLSGVWQYQGAGGAENVADEKNIPPMTPWAKAKFDKEIPGYGSRAAPGGNDPILQCDPIGFPRVMFMPTPIEFVQAPGRVLQFFEREHEWRPIWTDGRSLPEDADPAWYGHAIGHWEDDYTFVVESSGFNEKTWLTPGGYPHTEEMHTTERYQRVDHDTILYNVTIVDPKAYTKPIEGRHVTFKLRLHVEIEELPCVWSEENAFTKRIREPAAAKPTK
jgi:hypothetical protein